MSQTQRWLEDIWEVQERAVKAARGRTVVDRTAALTGLFLSLGVLADKYEASHVAVRKLAAHAARAYRAARKEAGV